MSLPKLVPACLLLAALSLTACASGSPPPIVVREYIEVRPEVPAALGDCPDEPAAPAADADEPTFWGWVDATIEAGHVCRAVVKARRLLDRQP